MWNFHPHGYSLQLSYLIYGNIFSKLLKKHKSPHHHKNNNEGLHTCTHTIHVYKFIIIFVFFFAETSIGTSVILVNELGQNNGPVEAHHSSIHACFKLGSQQSCSAVFFPFLKKEKKNKATVEPCLPACLVCIFFCKVENPDENGEREKGKEIFVHFFPICNISIPCLCWKVYKNVPDRYSPACMVLFYIPYLLA